MREQEDARPQETDEDVVSPDGTVVSPFLRGDPNEQRPMDVTTKPYEAPDSEVDPSAADDVAPVATDDVQEVRAEE